MSVLCKVSWYGCLFQKLNQQKLRTSCCCFFNNSSSSSLPFRQQQQVLSFCVSPSPNRHSKPVSTQLSPPFPFLSGLEDVMMGYISGNTKATEVAHLVWRNIIQKGDTLVDATCGNGYDTLAMIKMIVDTGYVYAMDIQEQALENTSSLFKESLYPDETKHVELTAICHSKMEEIVPKNATVRLVAFNLGYLPGGDKAIITKSNTTLLALEAAKRILTPGGLISTLVYIGHSGGREEFETVEAFAAELAVDNWICCKLQKLNRPLAPILVLIWKK